MKQMRPTAAAGLHHDKCWLNGLAKRMWTGTKCPSDVSLHDECRTMDVTTAWNCRHNSAPVHAINRVPPGRETRSQRSRTDVKHSFKHCSYLSLNIVNAPTCQQTTALFYKRIWENKTWNYWLLQSTLKGLNNGRQKANFRQTVPTYPDWFFLRFKKAAGSKVNNE
jgi:hypothetical protein